MARGAASNTDSGVNSSPANQVAKPSMPARASTLIQERDSASNCPNHACRSVMAASVAVFIGDVAARSRLISPRVRAEATSPCRAWAWVHFASVSPCPGRVRRFRLDP